MIESKLNKLQTDFLAAFFSHESSFFLTGGAALAGFYLGHRATQDLDLFTLENEIEAGVSLMRESARHLDATVESIQTSPDFRRFLVRRDNESIVVDLIREYVYQQTAEKPVINGIRVDPADEILANKLCALLSRSEIRDLVDVYELEKAGLNLTEALAVAEKKDTGLSAAQLAWILHQIHIGDETTVPSNVSGKDLAGYLSDLILRLQKLAAP